MPRVKALLLDMDGTLLTSERRISPGTLAALASCRAQGLRVFVATARPPLLAKMLSLTSAEAAALTEGGVFYNGGCVYTPDFREYNPMAETAVATCLTTLNASPHINFAVQMTEERHAVRWPLPDDELALWGVERKDLIGLDAVDIYPVIKFVVFSPVDALPDLRSTLAARLAGEASIYLTGKPGDFQAVEVMAAGCTKKLGADRLLTRYGIKADEVAVFGDDVNDAEMLAGFPISVAMGNASPDVQALARHVTLTNDQDGIVWALDNLLAL